MTDVHALADDLGVLGMAEVERLGLGPRDLMRLVRAGRLVHLSRGWYAVPLSPAATPKVVHLQRLRAAERKYEGSAMGSHHSELLQLGLPAFGADLATVHLSRTRPRAQHRHSPGLMVHRPVPSGGHPGHWTPPPRPGHRSTRPHHFGGGRSLRGRCCAAPTGGLGSRPAHGAGVGQTASALGPRRPVRQVCRRP